MSKEKNASRVEFCPIDYISQRVFNTITGKTRVSREVLYACNGQVF